MRAGVISLFFIISLQALQAQINIETTGTTQGFWQTAVNGRGETFVVGNNGTIIRKRSACLQWETVPVPVTNGLRAITFIQDSIGVAVGVSGTIFRSTNWGDTWTLIGAPNSAGLLGILNLNDSILLATGGGTVGNLVIRSSDLGLTWTIQTTLLSGSGFDLAAANDSTVFVVGVNGTVQRSTDYGISWNPVGAFTGTLMSVAFGDNQVGMIVGQNGAIHRTIDGGNTWLPGNSPTTTTLNRIVAFSPTTYMANGLSGTLIQTQDGGLNWNAITTGNSTLLRVLGKNSTGFYAAGNSGLLFTFQPNLGYTTLFSENFCNFSDSTGVPTGWSNNGYNAPNSLWRFDNPQPAAPGIQNILEAPFATFNANFYNNTGADSSSLTTPAFSTIGHTQVSLQWHEVFTPQAAGQTHATIEAFNGTSWQVVYRSNGARNNAAFTTTQTGIGGAIQTKRSIDISAVANQSQVQLRFTFSGTGIARNSWAIDNIEVLSAPTDLAIDSLFAYSNACQLPTVDQPFVVVKNNSPFAVYPIQLAYRVNNDPIQFTFHNQSLAAGQSVQLPVSTAPIGIAAPGNLQVWLAQSFDAVPSNDTLGYAYNNAGGVTIGFNADTVYLCPNSTVTLRGPSVSGSFQWSGAGTGSADTLVATQPGWYILNLIANGCSSTDSLFVKAVPLPVNTLDTIPDTIFTSRQVFISSPPGISAQCQIITNGNSVFLGQIFGGFLNRFPVGETRIILTMVINGCTIVYEKTIWVIENIGLENLQPHLWQAYPVPFSSMFTIEGPYDRYTIQVRNTLGQTVYTTAYNGSHHTVNTAQWPTGMYFIERIRNLDGQIEVQKIIKQNQ